MKKEFIIRRDSEGFQWRFTTDNKKNSLSIVCHNFSYGREEGLFETQCSWLPDVQGGLTFEQVARKIKTIYKLEKGVLKE